MDLENTADNVEQVVKLTLARCKYNPQKAEEELKRCEKDKIFYERLIEFLKQSDSPFDDALMALIETTACIDAMLEWRRNNGKQKKFTYEHLRDHQNV